ncbi:MAG: DNA cytosine methyltransferase [Deltaproteobacteria bacterium]|nr:DNA cytosine methyltransferase [Deltaproteobacteria bacterium]
MEGDYAFTVDSVNSGGIKITEATKQGYAVAEEGDSINLSVPNSKTRRGRVGKGEAQTLDTGMQQYTIQSGIRRLTPTECERLQGFSDGWTDIVSDTQRYKIMGNAVTVDIVEMIGRALLQDYRRSA